MEEKDQILKYQSEEIRKVTQLQAQLQVARDKLEVMNASSEVWVVCMQGPPCLKLGC